MTKRTQICSPCLDHQPTRGTHVASSISPHAAALTNLQQSAGEGSPRAKCHDLKLCGIHPKQISLTQARTPHPWISSRQDQQQMTVSCFNKCHITGPKLLLPPAIIKDEELLCSSLWPPVILKPGSSPGVTPGWSCWESSLCYSEKHIFPSCFPLEKGYFIHAD